LVRAHFYGIPAKNEAARAADADFTIQDAQVFNFAKAPSTSTEPVLDLPMGLLLWAVPGCVVEEEIKSTGFPQCSQDFSNLSAADTSERLTMPPHHKPA
jgi:hypothetical protein